MRQQQPNTLLKLSILPIIFALMIIYTPHVMSYDDLSRYMPTSVFKLK